jgi:polyphenol oxidase
VNDPADMESPTWGIDRRLAVCGFTLRGSAAPAATTNRTQVHGNLVHIVDAGDCPAEGDGLWTNVPRHTVAVRVADCVPILLWDPVAGAVAAVHAGWRGTAQDIVGEALRVGLDLGVTPARVRAAIGPCIGRDAFEVGEEVVEGLRDLGLDDACLRLQTGPRGKPHVDLRSVNRALLVRRGVPDALIEDVGGCSYSNPDRYESYRRDGARSGRMRGLIALAGLLMMLLTACTPTTYDPGTVVDEAREAIEEGGAVRAEAQLRAHLERMPDDPLARAVLGRALHRQGRHHEASVQSRLALGSDPGLWQAAYNLACHHAALGDHDQAIHWLQAAIAGDEVTREQVRADSDLAVLLDDHRMAFYLAGGILSRQEEDAIATVSPTAVAVGEPATLTLVALSLNRPLMGERSPLELRPLRPLPPGVLQARTRRETFSTGAEGGREYAQRTVHFGFRATTSGTIPLGPFKVQEGERQHRTGTPILEVGPGVASGPGPGPSALGGGFLRAPSEVDGALIADHVARGGALIDLSDPPLVVPWTPGPHGDTRVFRFRASDLDGLPDALPEREDPVFRSILVQRASEGWSHVLEVRVPPA